MKKDTILIFDFIIYKLKCLLHLKLNYYDFSLSAILDEYDYILDFKKEWKKRYEKK